MWLSEFISDSNIRYTLQAGFVYTYSCNLFAQIDIWQIPVNVLHFKNSMGSAVRGFVSQAPLINIRNFEFKSTAQNNDTHQNQIPTIMSAPAWSCTQTNDGGCAANVRSGILCLVTLIKFELRGRDGRRDTPCVPVDRFGDGAHRRESFRPWCDSTRVHQWNTSALTTITTDERAKPRPITVPSRETFVSQQFV